MSINKEKCFKGKNRSFVRVEAKKPDQNWGRKGFPGDTRIELKFEEGEGVCEERGEERANCKDRETGREEQEQRHGPGWRQVAGGELELEVCVRVSKAWLGQGNQQKEKKARDGSGRREMFRPWWPWEPQERS